MMSQFMKINAELRSRWRKPDCFLVNTGHNFTDYQPAKGNSWWPFTYDTTKMASDVYFKIALTSHDNSLLNTATLDNDEDAIASIVIH